MHYINASIEEATILRNSVIYTAVRSVVETHTVPISQNTDSICISCIFILHSTVKCNQYKQVEITGRFSKEHS